MAALFRSGEFVAASGAVLPWKVECDALTAGDWECLAAVAAKLLPPFGRVEGVPAGGERFAAALREHVTNGCETLLIADDVLTTGGSMERHRAGRQAVGVVAFARRPTPPWVQAVWWTRQV